MTFEIIAIGNEVLSGMIVNTNAAIISSELAKVGWHVARHSVLPDDPKTLREGLREALSRADFVITTGGLGPTCDDITKEAASEVFATASPTPLNNRVGTASGWLFQDKKRGLALLPGPPREMSTMLTNELMQELPKILGKHPEMRVARTLHLSMLREESVDAHLRKLSEEYPGVHAGVYPGYGNLTVRFSGKNSDEVHACVQAMLADFETYLFEAPHGKIEEAIHALFKEQGKKLAFAESCTGGKMAAQITALPGASDFFLGSLIVYSNSFKTSFLDVSEKTLQEYGAVSREVVQEMLDGIFQKTNADWAIAVSGIAGPSGGTPEKPVGTVWAAIGEKGKTADAAHMCLPLSRETWIAVVSTRLLGALWRKIRFNIPFRSFER